MILGRTGIIILSFIGSTFFAMFIAAIATVLETAYPQYYNLIQGCGLIIGVPCGMLVFIIIGSAIFEYQENAEREREQNERVQGGMGQ